MPRQLFARLSATVQFWAEALSRPRMIGAVAPSSRRLATAMASWPTADPRAWIVELGPGTGCVTRALLERGHVPERLLAVEKSAKMVELLRREFPRVQVIEGDALELGDLIRSRGCAVGEVAQVVSSLPLVGFDPAVADGIRRNIYDVLQPGGLYVQFTYHLNRKPSDVLRRYQVQATRVVWWNLPPARVTAYRKG